MHQYCLDAHSNALLAQSPCRCGSKQVLVNIDRISPNSDIVSDFVCLPFCVSFNRHTNPSRGRQLPSTQPRHPTLFDDYPLIARSPEIDPPAGTSFRHRPQQTAHVPLYLLCTSTASCLRPLQPVHSFAFRAIPFQSLASASVARPYPTALFVAVSVRLFY